MRDYRDNNRREPNYGDYNQNYSQHDQDWQNRGSYQGQRYADLGDTRREPGENYRIQQSQEYGRRGGEQGIREDYYKRMYDISNYNGVPRSYDYGLPNGPVDELDDIRQYPLSEGPYAHREQHRYSYSQGYNPNYDNPEEGDMYRDFDSRGNFGFRHDPGYGSTDEFREFGNDHYGRPDETGDRYYGHFGGYNR